MNIEVDRKLLKEAFSLVAKVGRSKIDRLANVKLSTKDNSVTLGATNGETGIECQVSATVNEDGALLIPTERLGSILSVASSETVSISISGSQAVLKLGKSKFKIPTPDLDTFPNPIREVAGEPYSLTGKEFKRLVAFTAFAVADGAERYSLNGVNLIMNGSVIMAATDTRHFATSSAAPGQVGDEVNAIVSVVPLVSAANHAADEDVVEIAADANTLNVKVGNCHVSSSLIEGRFIAWEQLISGRKSDDRGAVFDIPAGAIRSCVEQASAVIEASSLTCGISLQATESELAVESVGSDVGHARSVADIEGKGGDVQLEVDYRYLLRMSRQVPPDTILSVSMIDEHTAILFSAGEFTYMLQPLSRKNGGEA